MRILNPDELRSHGNRRGRAAMVEILEAGLQAGDPYYNAQKLIRREGKRLIVGCPDFEPEGDPRSGDQVIDLTQVGRIYVVGAGKGVQRVAKALEEALGPRLTGGHVIAKHGDELILERISVTFGAHPVPDEGCVLGCQRILALVRDLRPNDLVFTIVSNGVSSLLTLPVEGVSLEDVRRTTYLMQIERGAPTGDLNTIRNHLDVLKGGRLIRTLQPAQAIHLVVCPPATYEQLLCRNLWLHNLPECSTFADAITNLKKWDAWEAVPASVRAHLERADPTQETVKPQAFEQTNFRVFGIMPPHLGILPSAQRTAAALGFRPVTLAENVCLEASHVAGVVALIARTVERTGQPFEPPCALFTGGEMVVTVGQERGMGGRNQEYAVAAALQIAGSRQIVVGSVDSDGTDGPGHQFSEGEEADAPVLTGGIVDGETLREAQALGLDLHEALRRHNTSPALYRLHSGVIATQNISLNDLTVTLVLGREQ